MTLKSVCFVITKALGTSKVSKDHACARMAFQWLLTGGNWNVEDHHYAEGLPNSAQTLELQSLQSTAFRVGRDAGQKAAGIHVAVATETQLPPTVSCVPTAALGVRRTI
jgi:hypothetical protein